jgi:hypothetical protein
MTVSTTLGRACLLALLCLAACACASTSAATSGGSRPQTTAAGSGTTPPGSSGPPTGTYVPAAGTDNNGALFETYTDRKGGYHMLVPGGWHASKAHGIVRIARLGNVIVIASRPGKFPPKAKGVKTALQKQLKKHKILDVLHKPRTVDLPHAGKAVRVVFSKDHPASDTEPEGTTIVYRYLLQHGNTIVVLSLQTPDTRDNGPVYDLLADSFTWDTAK